MKFSIWDLAADIVFFKSSKCMKKSLANQLATKLVQEGQEMEQN